jgi:hypothetical protein
MHGGLVEFKTERPRFLGNSFPDGGNSCLASLEYDAGYGVLGTGTELSLTNLES